MNIKFTLISWIEKALKTDIADEKLSVIKEENARKIDETTAIIKKTGQLQKVVMKRTTTYYIGRGIGAVK